MWRDTAFILAQQVPETFGHGSKQRSIQKTKGAKVVVVEWNYLIKPRQGIRAAGCIDDHRNVLPWIARFWNKSKIAYESLSHTVRGL
jgi:hypothetical protein